MIHSVICNLLKTQTVCKGFNSYSNTKQTVFLAVVVEVVAEVELN